MNQTALACVSCKDSGRVYDPISDTVIRCSCWPERTARLALEKAGIYPEYRASTFDDIIPRPEFPNQQQVVDFCRAYAAKWPEIKAEGRSLAILGQQPSMGKSHLASSICLELIKNHWTRSVVEQDVCLFVNVSNWFYGWKRHWSRYPPAERGTPEWQDQMDDSRCRTERKALSALDERMFTTELLVLDDLTRFDVSERKNLDKVYALVDHRLGHGLPIVVTDNLATWPEISRKLGADYGPPITDRFQRNGDTLVIEMPLTKRGKKKS